MADELIFKMRAVLDMTDPNEKVEAFRRSASESTFATPGTASRSPSASPAERQARVAERSSDYADSHVVAWGEQKRANAFGYAARQGFSDWIGREELSIASRARNQPMWSPFLTTGDMPAFGSPSAILPEGESNAFDVAPNVRMGSTLRDQVNRRKKNVRRRRIVAQTWQRGGDVAFDPFDEENFSSNLDEAVADAESKQPQAKPRSWSQRNLPTFHRFLGKGGNMSVFYRRFLALEAARTVGALAEQSSEFAGGIASAGAAGDPLAMAQFYLQDARRTASAIPFGIGSAVYSVENGIYGTSTAVGQAQLARANEQGTEARLNISRERLSAYESATTMIAPFGSQRQIAAVEQQRQADLRGARDREHAEMSELTAQAEREKTSIKARHQGAGLRESVLDDMGWYQSEYDDVDNAMGPKRADAAKRRRSDERNADIVAGYRRQDAIRERDTSLQQYRSSVLMHGVRTERNPDSVINTQYEQDVAATQFLPEEFREPAKKEAEARRVESQFNLQNSRTAMADNLAIRETVTGMTAQAYGPGANLMRRRAAITATAAGAENEAQSILRQDSTKFGRSAADTARNIGINEIETQRAQYMEGLHMRSVSPTMIAAGNPAASRPDQVMRMMDEGTGMLRRNVGNYDVTTGKSDSVGGTTNTILMQILQVLQTGGGSRLGD